jgi:hypothetical protein
MLDLSRVQDPGYQPAVDEAVGWWTSPGRVILAEDLHEYDDVDSECFTARRTPGALAIVQACAYDPGSAVYRFHSAVNHATPHGSAFFRLANNNPYTSYRQHDMWLERETLAAAIGAADVAIAHVDTFMFGYVMMQRRPDCQVVVYYHGSEHPTDAGKFSLCNHDRDRHIRALQVGARLNHQDYGDLAWVPMAQPVRRYWMLRRLYALDGRPGTDRPFRIAHSPTYRSTKGTELFLAAVRELVARGYNVEAVPIEKHQHPTALAWKGTCDACYDSLWLGMQGSGLEAGAMGMPVLAGDDHNRALYAQYLGECPYTFVNDGEAIVRTVIQLIRSPDFYSDEAARVTAYVWRWHSYEKVAALFLNALHARTENRELKEKIERASHTAFEPNDVRPMRPGDDYPWLKDDSVVTCDRDYRGRRDPNIPTITVPAGEPIRVPKRKITIPSAPKIHQPVKRKPLVRELAGVA